MRDEILKSLDVGGASRIGSRLGEEARVIKKEAEDGGKISFMNDKSVPQDLHM